MKDAFGASFYLKTALLFIAIFASMLAVALNYSKAFRVKDTILSYIESNESRLDSNIGLSDSLMSEIDGYVADMKYYVKNANPGSSVEGYTDGGCNARGYCIYRYSHNSVLDSNLAEYRGEYYKVITFIQIEFPFFDLDISVPVTGETSLLVPKED